MNGTVGYAQKSPVYSFLPYNYWNIKSDYKSQIKNQVRICTCLSKVKLLIIYLQCIVMELHRKFYINLPSQIKKTWKTKRKQSGDRKTGVDVNHRCANTVKIKACQLVCPTLATSSLFSFQRLNYCLYMLVTNQINFKF